MRYKFINFLGIFFCIFISLVSICVASPGEEFEENLKETARLAIQVVKLVDTELNKSHLENKNRDHYIKNLFYEARDNILHWLKTVKWKDINDQSTFDRQMFSIYVGQVHLIKAFQDERFLLGSNELSFMTHADCMLRLFNITLKHSSESLKELLSWLILEPKRKDESGIEKYAVRLNLYNCKFSQQRLAKDTLQRLEKLDLEALKLPKEYKEHVSLSYNNIRPFLQKITKAKLTHDTNYNHIKQLDLSIQPIVIYADVISIWEVSKNIETINTLRSVREQVFNPLNGRFPRENSPSDICELTAEEREINIPLLRALFEEENKETMSASVQETSMEKSRNIFPKKKKKQIKKTSNNTTNLVSQINKERKEEVPVPNPVNISMQVPVAASAVKKEETCYDQNPKDTAENNTEIIHDDPSLETREWLTDIMKETTKKGEYFSIHNKAYSLFTQLKEFPNLIEQIQEATCTLALRLQEDKFIEAKKKDILFVPEKLEPDFRYLISTPICNLKGLRFTFVTRLLSQLGGKIDVSREGSRVGIELNGNKMTLHLHDSKNGTLDGGRLVSLRKLIIDSGFMTRE